jgi:hypothetical protein
MRKNIIRNISVILFLISAVFVTACGQTGQVDKAKRSTQASVDV